MRSNNDRLPIMLRRLNSGGLALLTVAASVLVMVMLVQRGTWDPKPMGESVLVLEPGSINGRQLLTSVDGPFSTRVTMQMPSAQAALVVQSEASALYLALDSIGFLAIWEQVGERRSDMVPWQTWPHLDSAENEIWLDADDNRWQIRFNRELFYDGEPLVASPTQLGVWSDTPITITKFELFQP